MSDWEEQAKKEATQYMVDEGFDLDESRDFELFQSSINVALGVAQKEIDYLVSQYSEIIKTKDKRIELLLAEKKEIKEHLCLGRGCLTTRGKKKLAVQIYPNQCTNCNKFDEFKARHE